MIKLNTENMIDVSDCKLTDLVKGAYKFSVPVGYGYMHYDPKPMTDEEAESLIFGDDFMPVNLDYVKGRCCKFNVYKVDDKYYIAKDWYDHSKEDLQNLLNFCRGE